MSTTSYLEYIHERFVRNVREVNGQVWVDDSLQLEEVVTDVLEGRAAIHHVVQDTAQRPHVTLHTNLYMCQEETRYINTTTALSMIIQLPLMVFFT